MIQEAGEETLYALTSQIGQTTKACFEEEEQKPQPCQYL